MADRPVFAKIDSNVVAFPQEEEWEPHKEGENIMKPFTNIAIFIFGLVALLHLLRLFFGWEVTFNGMVIPMWVSIFGLIIAGGLAVLLWRESRQAKL